MDEPGQTTTAVPPPDPMDERGLAGFADDLRANRTSIAATTEAYLARIEALNPRLGAYQHIDGDRTLAQARALDALLAAGTDLGPLMGVPVAIKDIVVVDGMPTTNGSNLDMSDVMGPEGTFVRALKHAGCVILGKTKTVEFAMGSTGINHVRGTPWNPWDASIHRIPGGSSSGSASALGAGLCAFAIGTDTGGSVRMPAAVCGLFGLKTTKGLWPTDGVYPLCPTLDSIGPLTRTAADAAFVFAALQDCPAPQPAPPRGIRLGRPQDHFLSGVDADVERCASQAVDALANAGVEIVDMEIPHSQELRELMLPLIASEAVAVISRERFVRAENIMDPSGWGRMKKGLETRADEYLRAAGQHEKLARIADAALADLDGWVTPTVPLSPLAVDQFETRDGIERLDPMMPMSTRIASYFRLCAINSPIQMLGAPLPAGLQIISRAFSEAHALSIGLMLEEMNGPPPRADVGGFL
ncbi:MAG: amidase [Rhodospirillales bacterium]|jgi:aspartyl-tRNA(Asn)/glutamyl-tRNA(Gln) amidotransferase subunit A|nr:amidase [Rhodospirillales bacterium]MDP6805112.1 amidase [Rhodospirillales bacterium]